ncbi:MAG: hypothetical protein A2X32_10910 [Elusimicrobia bacterium GWC2_64_44]|nr:MAG: hypothetical protein A2X32_10910 [Elusimicrobia bacterium GWC2_64_44]
MLKVRAFLYAASAVIFFAAGASALDPVLLALNTPVKAGLKLSAARKAAPQARPAAAQDKAGYTDFDAVSVTDPLYREGAREMLKQVIKDESSSKETKKPVMRDAPISRGAGQHKVLKKPAVKKPLHTDPVKVKNSL